MTYLYAWTNPRRTDGTDGTTACDGTTARPPATTGGGAGSTRLPDPAGSGVLLAAGAPRPGPDAEARRHRDQRGRDHGLRDPDERSRGPRPPTPAWSSRPARPAAWPAPGTSSRPCWVGSPRSSTSAAADVSTRPPSGGPWRIRDKHCRAERVRDPGRVVRGPPPDPVVQGRQDRPRRRRTPLLPPPPPGPRRPLPPRPTAQRRHPLRTPDVGRTRSHPPVRHAGVPRPHPACEAPACSQTCGPSTTWPSTPSASSYGSPGRRRSPTWRSSPPTGCTLRTSARSSRPGPTAAPRTGPAACCRGTGRRWEPGTSRAGGWRSGSSSTDDRSGASRCGHATSRWSAR